MKENEAVLENGVIAGNYYNKYASGNPVVKAMMNGFHGAVEDLLRKSGVHDIHEVGCGEGQLAMHVARLGYTVRASDYSAEITALAQESARADNLNIQFFQRSVYELNEEDAAPLIMCCEVLEHLTAPEQALEAVAKRCRPYALFSVPREPAWCMLNMLRGKYWRSWGNTPGHLQHWSSRGVVTLLQKYFDLVEVRRPFPWTIALCRARVFGGAAKPI